MLLTKHNSNNIKTSITTFILIVITQSIFAQIANDKSQIVTNKVKSLFEKHCFTNSNSSCTSIWEKFDKQGNSIEWNMGRLGSIYKNLYDKNNRKILESWVDKLDSTKVNSTSYTYDVNNQLVQKGKETFKNFYNAKKQLIKQLIESQNIEQNIVRKTKTIKWTAFDKIDTEIVKTEIIEIKKPTEYNKQRINKKKYEYDENTNLIKEIHTNDGKIVNTILYKYDSLNRLIEKREKDIKQIKLVNRMKFGNRKDFTEFTTKISYYKNGLIKEKYTYFSDPCMSLDNHFLYKLFYFDNGLLKRADVYDDKLAFTISYSYEFY